MVTTERPIESATKRALDMRATAQAALEAAEKGRVEPAADAVYCCIDAKRGAVRRAKKEVKKYDDWLALRESLQEDQLDLFYDQFDASDEERV